VRAAIAHRALHGVTTDPNNPDNWMIRHTEADRWVATLPKYYDRLALLNPAAARSRVLLVEHDATVGSRRCFARAVVGTCAAREF
jgi:hypothetical protein